MQTGNGAEEGMCFGVEPVQEEIFYKMPTEFPGRQTDTVNDQ